MQPDAGMAVNQVVVVEEVAAKGAGILDGVEAAGEVGPVLQGLEVGFGVGIVI